MNKNLQKQQTDDKPALTNHSVEQEEIIDRQLKKIENLNEVIKSIETERDTLIEKLKQLQSNPTNAGNLDALNIRPEQLDSFKLLEKKFTKVMADNANLKDKNQELEHVVMQLQCETDTIVDYITMYQMERKKLNQKYKEKDESIRSLSTQLQVNKVRILNQLSFIF